MRSKRVYLSLGTNLGDRSANLRNTVVALETERIHVTATSSLYETEPQDLHDQPWFLNQVAACETMLFPMQLLSLLERLERQLGRVRMPGARPKGPRLIDLDILLYGSSIIESPRLQVPHPRMLERRFVLQPLAEIAPDLRHPRTGKPLASYLPLVSSQRISKISRE